MCVVGVVVWVWGVLLLVAFCLCGFVVVLLRVCVCGVVGVGLWVFTLGGVSALVSVSLLAVSGFVSVSGSVVPVLPDVGVGGVWFFWWCWWCVGVCSVRCSCVW